MKIESDDRNRSLEALGLGNLGSIHWNLPSPALYEEAIRRCEGTLSHLGRSWLIFTARGKGKDDFGEGA